MEGGEDWIMRPAVEGVCLYESLVNGALSLEDVARMNAALDVKAENEKRLRKSQED
jgi:hypothetical protein